VGSQCLSNNVNGSNNTGVGVAALSANVSGSGCTAVGFNALLLSTADANTAVGSNCLKINTTGINNTGIGRQTLSNNVVGNDLVAVGYNALINNIGSQNVAVGSIALASNSSGTDNSALGYSAGTNITTGSSNITIGSNSGANIVAGSNNIHIGISGIVDESNTTRIGQISGQTVAGGVNVIIDGNGLMGTIVSSVTRKENIKDIRTSNILNLNPVEFNYRDDTLKRKQYGFIAEEVYNIMPELVVHDKDGKIETVRYNDMISLLLNVVKRQEEDIKMLYEMVKKN
jgi:hypothetical protein